ncbi:MAG TPA: amidohydrolase family protein [Phycisphaerae bacterium]
MSIVLQNALLVDIDPPRVERGALRIGGSQIVQRGARVASQPGDDVVDCGGAVVMPGLVNGHTHLYSALAVGVPPPSPAPTNFLEILQRVWWRLDRAHDAESIQLSAQVGALDALRCGTTTLIDHHASPGMIEGSLELIEQAVGAVGLRGVLCYETTDRNGRPGGRLGLAENRRFLARCAQRRDGRFAGLVGAHAAFTLEDESLAALADLAREFDTGVHIHVAEDPVDDATCRAQFHAPLIDRLARHGLLRPANVFAHGTHLDAEATARINEAGLTIAHNPRSNMNNAVGYAPIERFHGPVMLGTDGIGGDMLTEAKLAWLKARDARIDITPRDVLAMLAVAARRASAALGVTVGRLAVGAAADVVITDYSAPTPLTADNLAGHFIFGLGPQYVRDVLIGGRWVMRQRVVQTCDEPVSRRAAVGVAEKLWQRMGSLP